MHRLSCLATIALALAAATAHGQGVAGAVSQRLVPDARSNALGGAFTAIASGPTAAWWNPGALGLNDERSVAAMPFSYRHLFHGSEEWLYSAGASGGGPGYGLGFNLNYLNYGPSRDLAGNVVGDESHEWTLHLGAGYDLSRVLFPSVTWIDWGIGATWKETHARFSTGNMPDGIVGTSNGSGRDADLGTLIVLRAPPHPPQDGRPGVDLGARIGFVFLNVLDREIKYDDSISDPLGQAYRLGLALEAALRDSRRSRDLLQARFAFDSSDFTGKVADRTAVSLDQQSAGVEVTVSELVSGRLGTHREYGGGWDSIYGLGLGGDLRSGFGARLDIAALPSGSKRVYQYSVSGWGRF